MREKIFEIDVNRGKIYVENFMHHIMIVVDKGHNIKCSEIENSIDDTNLTKLINQFVSKEEYGTMYLDYDNIFINRLFNITGVFNDDYCKLFENGFIMLLALCQEILRDTNSYIENTIYKD